MFIVHLPGKVWAKKFINFSKPPRVWLRLSKLFTIRQRDGDFDFDRSRMIKLKSVTKINTTVVSIAAAHGVA